MIYGGEIGHIVKEKNVSSGIAWGNCVDPGRIWNINPKGKVIV